VCKVVVTRDLVFAASGAYFPDQGLDIFALARRASIVGGNLAKKSGAYTAYVLPALEKFLDWQKTADPVSYSRFREIGASEVVFVDRHSLEVIHLWFPLDASGKPHAKTLDDWDQPLSGDDWRMQPVGQADEIFKAVEANPQWWRTPEKSLDRFLQLETTAKPLDVGPPFSSIRLDGSGAHWINKGACK
jgi:hypothetical protein